MNPHEMQESTENLLMNRRKFIGTTTLATLGVTTGLTFIPYDSAEANPLLAALGRFAIGIGAGILANTIYDYLQGGQKAHASPNYRTSQKKKVSYDYFNGFNRRRRGRKVHAPPLSPQVANEVIKTNERLCMGGLTPKNPSPVYGTNPYESNSHFFYALRYDLSPIPVFRTVPIHFTSYQSGTLAQTCALNNEIFPTALLFLVMYIDEPTIKGLEGLVADHSYRYSKEELRDILFPVEELQRTTLLPDGKSYWEKTPRIHKTAIGQCQTLYQEDSSGKGRIEIVAQRGPVSRNRYEEIFSGTYDTERRG